MSPNESSPEATVESLRPSSVWTNDSTFADSAISMGGMSTPKQFDDDQLELRSPSSSPPTLSERLTQLAAIAWAAEQDGYVDNDTKSKISQSLTRIEDLLEDREEVAEQADERRHAQDEVEDGYTEADRAQLDQIQQQLSATVCEMRLRRQEQRHIHELTIRKLEDIAGTCADQRKRIQDLEADMEGLETENRKLQRDNEGFYEHAEQLTAELQQKDVALQAMSSAVAGLDGWISDSLGPRRDSTRLEMRTRGRGRFKTQYYVEVPVERPSQETVDHSVEARELRDGITAWVRGFRDVEDALTTTASVQRPPNAADRAIQGGADQFMAVSDTTEEDDWGDFQTHSSRDIIS